jgi:hypothetical protein
VRCAAEWATGGNGFVVRWPSVNGVLYRLERSTNLTVGFTNWVSGILATPPSNVYTDPAPPGTAGFCRIGVE